MSFDDAADAGEAPEVIGDTGWVEEPQAPVKGVQLLKITEIVAAHGAPEQLTGLLNRIETNAAGELVLVPCRDQIYAAIAAATGEIARVPHDGKGHHNYTYASIDQIMAASAAALAANGLSIEMQPSASKTIDKHLLCIYRCRVCHGSGQSTPWFRREISVEHHPPQCYGSAESYVFKRFVRFSFCIPTGEGDDPDSQPKRENPPKRTGNEDKLKRATRKEIDAAKDVFTQCESVEEMEEAAKKMAVHVKKHAEVVAHAKSVKATLEDDVPPQYDGREPRGEEAGDAQTEQEEGAADAEAPPPEEQPAQEGPPEGQEQKPPSKTKLNALVKQIKACNNESELTSVCQDLPVSWLEIDEMAAAIEERRASYGKEEAAADGGGQGEDQPAAPEDESQAPPDDEEPW